MCLVLSPVPMSSITAAAHRIVSCAIDVSRSNENILKGAGKGSQWRASSMVISRQMSTGWSLSTTSPSTLTCIERSPSKKKRFTKGMSPDKIVQLPASSCRVLGTMNG